jgi:hypothetical protein
MRLGRRWPPPHRIATGDRHRRHSTHHHAATQTARKEHTEAAGKKEPVPMVGTLAQPPDHCGYRRRDPSPLTHQGREHRGKQNAAPAPALQHRRRPLPAAKTTIEDTTTDLAIPRRRLQEGDDAGVPPPPKPRLLGFHPR